ncbi:hypothetical protein AAE250_16165 [Bacteroides sp. GD17]|jgi:hypothetical protein|uniref:hypothetical protein n=1 Tax=Bacteroides sp. GD17 TaxID=3139826 RepID=UPI00204A676C|nr:hypothetical protein [uncultured Bacteroides sp.]DAV67241.1 MAG TPA: hypothetical protein [Caudoviricetes sp.]
MDLNNIEKARTLFPDAVKLQLRINQSATKEDIRRLLPGSVVLLSCKISKNYANVIYSEGAAKRMFPDATKYVDKIDLGNERFANIYRDDQNDGVKVMVNFLPATYERLINALEMAFGENLYQMSNYAECSMGCLFFKKTYVEDVAKVLLLFKEDA